MSNSKYTNEGIREIIAGISAGLGDDDRATIDTLVSVLIDRIAIAEKARDENFDRAEKLERAERALIHMVNEARGVTA